MADVLWTIVVAFWLVIFITLSVTHIKTMRVGGGLITLCNPLMLKEKAVIRIITILYFTVGILLFNKYSCPAFDDSFDVSQYFFVWIGVALFMIAIIIFISARVAIGSNWLWSGEMVGDRTKLITVKPYDKIRHPQYSAYILAGLATGLIITEMKVLLFVLFVFPIIYWRAFVEEQHLCMIFPEYKEYKEKTTMFF